MSIIRVHPGPMNAPRVAERELKPELESVGVGILTGVGVEDGVGKI